MRVPAPSQPRPTRAQLDAATDGLVADIIAPRLRVLFCGINPGLYSGALGQHFARPGNRFWKLLHLSGFTERELTPAEGPELLSHGVGITNIVERVSARADELVPDELRAGMETLRAKVRRFEPRVLAVLGMQAFRSTVDRKAALGRQGEPFEGAVAWLLPNPSGLQARYQLAEMTDAFAELRRFGEGAH